MDGKNDGKNDGKIDGPKTPAAGWLSVVLRWRDQAAAIGLFFVAALLLGGFILREGALRHRELAAYGPELPPPEFSIDLNSAEWTELALLPGIGEKLAKRIVESREQDGPFARPEQLRRVRGIGPRTWEKLQPFLRCD
ncbi:MAG TPA: helix-hairpin-helix domain-containing protein [Pirellulaceae bacterium]|nr:helix-hairpin-helix domain-containing protein [Pirellulaceae bacterium]